MKIKINNQETYDIAVAEEYSVTDFIEFSERINKIANIISLNAVKDTELKHSIAPKTTKLKTTKIQKTKVKKVKKVKGKRLWETREEALKVLRLHYHGTKDVKNAYANLVGKEWNSITKAFSNLIKRYNIQPSEIGLSSFSKKTESESDLELPSLDDIPNFMPQKTPTPPLEFDDDEKDIKFLAEDLI